MPVMIYNPSFNDDYLRIRKFKKVKKKDVINFEYSETN